VLIAFFFNPSTKAGVFLSIVQDELQSKFETPGLVWITFERSQKKRIFLMLKEVNGFIFLSNDP
jgi:hypothetical protein